MRLVTIAGFLLYAAVVPAAQPVQFSYQAKLSDASGATLSGQHTLYFDVFQGGDVNVANSGLEVYGESAMLSLAGGIVNHLVGTGVATTGTLDSAAFAYSGDTMLQVAVDSPGNFILPRTTISRVPLAARALDAPATLFKQFGGSGFDGDRIVSGTQAVGAIRQEYKNLTIPAGSGLDVVQGWSLIAVSGTCTIEGTISADGKGEGGGAGGISSGPSNGASGAPGRDATGLSAAQLRVPGCIAGAGGAGGGASFAAAGGFGGGGQSAGGQWQLGASGLSPTTGTVGIIMSGGSVSGSGRTFTSNFAPLLYYRGAGGGGGGAVNSAIAGAGGPGGGVVYIECNELVFTGSISATGGAGLIGPAPSDTGGGGGGGGGVVLVRARKITTSSGTVSADGGPGGSSPPADKAGAKGAPGFWDIVEVH